MIATLPKLRGDLDRRLQSTAEGTVLVIKDPLSRQFYRLRAAERFIAEQLDGETPLHVVNHRVENKFGATLPPEELNAFVKTLAKNSLLENGAKGHRAPAKPKRLDGGLMTLRFRLFDPDGLLNRLYPRVRFAFTARFLVFSAATILAAAAVSAFHWDQIVGDASQLYRLSTLPLLIAVAFAVTTAHEFGHGLACKHFGGEVREMGFMLIYFQPAFFCNVSDAWFFSKGKRLWVSFAGPYLELFIWALATLCWRVTDSDTWISRIALIVMATSGIKTFFNFNPLIKLDGYYLLSDYLGIVNLRKRAFRYLGDFLRTLGGWRAGLPEVARQERRVFLIYGIIAWTFSFLFTAYVALLIGEHLVVQGQRLAFFLFAGLVGVRFQGKFRRLFGHGKRARSEPRRRSRFLKSRFPKILLAAAVVILLFVVKAELRVAGPVSAFPIHNADVRAEIEGIIEVVYVDEGERVEAGQPIAALFGRDLQAELQKVEAQVAENKARLRLLEAGSRLEEIQLAQTTVARHQEQLKFLQSRLERYRQLNEQQLLSALDYEESARLVASSESDLAEASKKLQLLQAGSRPEEIEALRAMVRSLETQRAYLQSQLSLTKVLSPAAGIVTTPSRQLSEMRHQLVHKGDLIAKVFDFKVITAEMAIPEKEIADVRKGQTVSLKVRAYPDRVFPGTVTEIATTVQGVGGTALASGGKSGPAGGLVPESGKNANTILVTTEIDNRAGLLKPGMSGMAKIECGQRRLIDLITRRISRTFRVEFWSWW